MMDVRDMAAMAVRAMAQLHLYAIMYSSRKDNGKRILLPRKMIRRRIISLREWLHLIESQLEEDEQGGN